MSGLRTALAVSSILAMVLLPVLAAPVLAARTYTWTLDCKGASGILAGDGSANVRWDWMQDGQVIAGAGGGASCFGTMTVSGGGDRPANANGFTATLSVIVCSSVECNSNSDSVTRSFDPAGSFKATLSSSVSVVVGLSPGYDCLHRCHFKAGESAMFTLKS